MSLTLKEELVSSFSGGCSERTSALTTLLRFSSSLSNIGSRLVLELELETQLISEWCCSTLQELFQISALPSRSGGTKPSGGMPEQNLPQKFSLRIDNNGELLARKLGLIDNRGCPIRGLPNHLVLSSGEILRGVIRGALISSAAFTDPGRNLVLEVTSPTSQAARALIGTLNRVGVVAKYREPRGVARVTVRDLDMLNKLLKYLGAKRTWVQAEEWARERQSRTEENRLLNFEDANHRRSVQAAQAAADRVEEALNSLGGKAPQHLLYAAELRMKYRDMSLEELGAKAVPPLTKDAIAGRIRRLLTLAEKRGSSFPPGSSSPG